MSDTLLSRVVSQVGSGDLCALTALHRALEHVARFKRLSKIERRASKKRIRVHERWLRLMEEQDERRFQKALKGRKTMARRFPHLFKDVPLSKVLP